MKILQNPKQNIIIICVLVGLVLALIASNVYMYIQKNTPEPKVVVQNDEKVKLKTELDSLEAQIEQVNESKTKMSVEMQAKNDSLKTQIKILRRKLHQNNLTIAELEKTNEDVKELKSSVANYADEISRLKKKNDSLMTVSDTLKSKLASINEKAYSLEKRNQDLGSKVIVASAIKLAASNIMAYKIKGSGREVEVSRASQVKKIKINFTIANNPIAKKGLHDIYAQIIDPSGNMIASPDSSTFKAEGQVLQFTIKTSIEFKDDGSTYVIIWQNPAAFIKGTYNLLFFADGYSMGKTSFTLE